MTARKVLVIDDSADIQELVGQALKRLGIETFFAQDGESGIEIAKVILPDLILLDSVMPDMNGYQVSKVLGDSILLAKIPIVLMPSKGDMIGEKLVKTLGIVDYITKPFSTEALITVTQHALEKRLDTETGKSKEPAPLMEVGERKPEQPPTSEDLSDSRGRVAMRGLLGMIPAAEVFQLLKFQGHTGILHLARGQAHLEVFLHDGSISFARARNVDEEFLLGRFLIEVSAISPQDLEVFLKSRQGSNKLLGEQLVKLGHLSREQLHQALLKQTEALLFETLRWGEGEFAFYVTENLPPEAVEAGLAINVDHILIEGFRRVDEWGLIEKELRDFNVILAPNRDATGVIREISLEPDEKRILSLVDGKRSIREVIRESRRSSFDVCKILFRLLSSRMIRKRSTPTVSGEGLH